MDGLRGTCMSIGKRVLTVAEMNWRECPVPLIVQAGEVTKTWKADKARFQLR